MMWHWFNGGWGGFGGYGVWWFMPIIMIVVIGLVIWGIVALFRKSGGAGVGVCCGNPKVTTDPDLEILKRRYASGEISKEDFEKKKALI
jgi:putative membrane protein